VDVRGGIARLGCALINAPHEHPHQQLVLRHVGVLAQRSRVGVVLHLSVADEFDDDRSGRQPVFEVLDRWCARVQMEVQRVHQPREIVDGVGRSRRQVDAKTQQLHVFEAVMRFADGSCLRQLDRPP
jgi:hypothetical protein